MFETSSIPFWTAVAALAGVSQVLVLIVTALFVRRYLKETEKLRLAAQAQVEATFRPAVIALSGGSLESNPKLENIGNGPAMNLEWFLAGGELKGKLPIMRMHKPEELPFGGVKPLYNAMGPNQTTATIECSYRSLSGRRYTSTCTYNCERFEFITTFED
jgi:hypothetical protein